MISPYRIPIINRIGVDGGTKTTALSALLVQKGVT